MKQHEIVNRGSLLDGKGSLREPGFARSLILDYDRSAIKAGKLRIKEWDYYLVTCHKFAIALTIADNSYMGLDSISLLDFTVPWEHTNSPMAPFTLGRKCLPPSSKEGNVASGNKKYHISYENHGSYRILEFHMDNFCDGKPIEGKIHLECPDMDSMVIATPFKEDSKAFYYNQKINCMPARGTVRFGDKLYEFKEGESFGVLDWGRGVWTYKNTWYWGSASGIADGVPFGWNIGYGFGDTSDATENMLFYDNKAHKLGNVTFNIPMKNRKYITRGGCCGASGIEAETVDPTEDYMSPWTFTSDDGRFEMDFVPIIDRASCTDVKLICSDQHQVFGKYTGRAILDDGKIIEVRDFLGFAEKVFNKW
ncbi:MAG: DUF2804 domain-containing protein [Eubacteriaceae bacterium]|nr:DUF2804 domain-containing protein [Eubacteriaceae bacterium]